MENYDFTPACPSTEHDVNIQILHPYPGVPGWFHCGFSGYEGPAPVEGGLQQECFYDHSGHLVTHDHPYGGCAGSPNEYDASTNPILHTVYDHGGILSTAGLNGFITSSEYATEQANTQYIKAEQSYDNQMLSLGTDLLSAAKELFSSDIHTDSGRDTNQDSNLSNSSDSGICY